MCSHRLEDVQHTCDHIAILNEGELQAYGEVQALLQDVNRVEMQAKGLQLSAALRRDLEEVLRKHGGDLESLGHPTTSLEDYFMRIVEESKKHPGRRFVPGRDDKPRDGPTPKPPATGEATERITERR
jgi:ABC-2 type transport system ATP-binding protein